jgi:hypothetical protein
MREPYANSAVTPKIFSCENYTGKAIILSREGPTLKNLQMPKIHNSKRRK